MQQVLSAQCALFRGVPSLLFLFPVFGGYGKYTRCMRRRNNQRGQSHSLVYKCLHAAFPSIHVAATIFSKVLHSLFLRVLVSCLECSYACSQRMSKDRNALPSIPVSVQLGVSPALPSSCCCCCPQFPGCCLQLQRPSHVTCAPSHPNLYWLFKTIIDTSSTSFREEA